MRIARHSFHPIPLVVVAVSIALSVAAVVSAIEFTNGLSADLSVTATAPATADRGQMYLQTFTVTNLGSSVAHGVTLTQTLPMGLQFSAAGSSSACRLQGDTVTCTLGTLADNAPHTIAVALRTPVQDACTERTFQSNATVKADESDPVSGNNATSILSTVIRCVPAPAQCADGTDNDRDGLIDIADPGCRVATDDNEALDSIDMSGISTEERLRLRLLERQGRGIALPPIPVPVPPPVPSPFPELDPVSGMPVLTLTASQDQTEAQAGDTVIFTLTARNTSDIPVQGALATFRFDAGQIGIKEAQDAVSDYTQVQWTIDLNAHQTRVLRFAAEVSPTVLPGQAIAVTADLDGPSGAQHSVMTLAIVGHLPATGAGDFTGPFADARAFLSPLSSASALPGILWLSVIAMGVASGASMARKFR